MDLVKAHAYGNDFLLARMADVELAGDPAALARRLCDRHRGLGADGLMLTAPTERGAATRLLNADGSRSEISGNGIRCVAAWLARRRKLAAGASVVIDTEAGERPIQILQVAGSRYWCKAAMGLPRDVRQVSLEVAGQSVTCVVANIGNPQCVVLGDAASLSSDRLHTIAAGLAVHPFFPEGTNVELAHVESPGTVRMLIWERGVGPTEASGTGACGAAIAAATFGGADGTVDVIAPGGTQRVSITPETVWLTGWAEVIGRVDWWGSL